LDFLADERGLVFGLDSRGIGCGQIAESGWKGLI